MAWLVQKTGRTGWYYRVLGGGAVEAGTALELVERPHPNWTIARLNAVIASRTLDCDELNEMASLTHLSASWRDLAQRRVEACRVEDWSSRLWEKPNTDPST
jgi:MOSC domain-containing protein YiiM